MLKRLSALFASALVVAACAGPSTTSLTVTTLVPEDEATSVSVSTVVSATFNLGIDVDTLDGAFTLMAGDELVAGELTYDAGARRATFTPDDDLAFATVYTATIAGTVATTDGTTLGGAASWSFTTVSDATEMAFVANNAYAAYVGDADVTADPISLAFPAFTGGQEPFTYTLVGEGALPPDFEAQAYTDPVSNDPVLAATYAVTLNPTTGEIAGRTGFPGAFVGVVRVTDANNAFLEAAFNLDLAFVMAYQGPFEQVVDATADVVVVGARVTVSGVNILALPDTGMERTFTLTFDEPASEAPAVAADFSINSDAGTISKAATDPAIWVYHVDATHTATNRVSEVFTFTFTQQPPPL